MLAVFRLFFSKIFTGAGLPSTSILFLVLGGKHNKNSVETVTNLHRIVWREGGHEVGKNGEKWIFLPKIIFFKFCKKQAIVWGPTHMKHNESVKNSFRGTPKEPKKVQE